MKRISKKDLILSLNAAGRSVVEIAVSMETTTSYVSNVLADAKRIKSGNISLELLQEIRRKV